MVPPNRRHRRVYNKEERKVMNPFKADYLKTTTPAQRKAMAKGDIFPALFTYWSSCGVNLTTDEMDTREEVSRLLKTNFNL
jgi:hypothetical protein